MNERLQRQTDRVIWAVAAVFLVIFSLKARADEPTTVSPSPGFETYRAECGACHIAYPPQLLPASSWQSVMAGLDKHFGVDASLDDTTARNIAAFLARNGGAYRKNTSSISTPALRITQTAWFRHEHDELPPTIWKRKSIGSPSNCTACHADAAQGRFSEHSVRIPRE